MPDPARLAFVAPVDEAELAAPEPTIADVLGELPVLRGIAILIRAAAPPPVRSVCEGLLSTRSGRSDSLTAAIPPNRSVGPSPFDPADTRSLAKLCRERFHHQ